MHAVPAAHHADGDHLAGADVDGRGHPDADGEQLGRVGVDRLHHLPDQHRDALQAGVGAVVGGERHALLGQDPHGRVGRARR